jgi:hypothetical protein
MDRTNWAPLINGNLSRVYFPVFVVASKEESGRFKMTGGASRGRMSNIKGGPVVTFEPPQLTVNGPHCVAGEYNAVKPTVAARGEKRARVKRERSMSHGSRPPQRRATRASLLDLVWGFSGVFLGLVWVRRGRQARRRCEPKPGRG